MISKYTSKLEQLPGQQATLASLIRNRDAHEKMYTLLLEKREEMRVAELSKMQDIIVLDPAVEGIKPISPNKKLNLLFAGLFGLIFGFFGVLIAQTSDNKIGDIWEIENNFNFPILTVIPPYDKKMKINMAESDLIKDRFVSMMEEHFKYKEAYRRLETKLVSKIAGKPKNIMITSCEENAGKTSAACNLAITMAQSGKKVLLVDCDIKNPSLSEQFGLPKYSSGLIDYLLDKTETPNIYKPVKLTNNSEILLNLDILPTGEFSNISGEILSTERMKKLLSSFEYYDFIIYDTPPITRLSDALALGRIIKDTILVIRPGQTVKESINWAIAELRTSEINFHGAIINDCEVRRDNFKYQYGYERN
jgi:capsular exopolysaccharide synthesis family protein